MGRVNIIDYVTIASVGNATDFGDLTQSRDSTATCSSTTRGLTAGGDGNSTFNIIDYVTIASTGNASDFGDLSVARRKLAGVSSNTRGVFGGGSDSNVLDYVTIATTGNAADFGDLIGTMKEHPAGISSKIIGIIAGGVDKDGGGSDVQVATMDAINIASTGNATDYGDLTLSVSQIAGNSNSHGGLA